MRTKIYQPIMPNSQLIIIIDSADTSHWVLELFVNPTSKLLLIALIIGVGLVILFIIVVVMQIREYKKDQRERLVEKLY